MRPKAREELAGERTKAADTSLGRVEVGTGTIHAIAIHFRIGTQTHIHFDELRAHFGVGHQHKLGVGVIRQKG